MVGVMNGRRLFLVLLVATGFLRAMVMPTYANSIVLGPLMYDESRGDGAYWEEVDIEELAQP